LCCPEIPTDFLHFWKVMQVLPLKVLSSEMDQAESRLIR
jgi:hypothetical protein